MPDFVLKFLGRRISDKLNLEEGIMNDTKKWYLSKGIWTGVITAVIGLYLSLAGQFHWPAIPEWIFTVLGAIGVYSRMAATTKIE